MGAGNFATGVFGLPPGSSSFARARVNYQSGAVSQLPSILSSVVAFSSCFWFRRQPIDAGGTD